MTAETPVPTPDAFAATVANAPVPRTEQKVWLGVYWAGFGANALLLLNGIIGIASRSADFTIGNFAIAVLAAVAALIGAVFATRIYRAGVTTVVFVKGTTTVRFIAVAWLLIQLAIVASVVVSEFGEIPLEELQLVDGFLGAVGSVSLLAVIASGYSEYREALGERARPTKPRR